MVETPETPSTLEEPTEKLEEPGSETTIPPSEEDVTYEEVTTPSPDISIPEIPEFGAKEIEVWLQEEAVISEEEKTTMPREVIQPTEVGEIPDIPNEESWSEVVYEEGGPPLDFQG